MRETEIEYLSDYWLIALRQMQEHGVSHNAATEGRDLQEGKGLGVRQNEGERAYLAPIRL